MARQLLEEELDLVDVCLYLRKVDVGLVDDERPLLSEELSPLIVVLVPQEGDGLEDGRAGLELL